jgi:NO-binding membrane sensor protein with MHYT domain
MGPMGTISETGFGWLTPVLSYLMACVGGALGLRATLRAVRAADRRSRRNWLTAAAIAIGTGIWTMHFIAMLGFTIPGQTIHYNVPITLLSLLVAVGIVCTGLLITGFARLGSASLLAGGVITGLGVAVMHYLGMAAMRMDGRVT